MTLVCLRLVWEGLKVTPSPHQEQDVGLVMVAEGQMRHTIPYQTSLRPPMSTGWRHLNDTPPSPLSYSQLRETGADGGAEEIKQEGLNKSNESGRWEHLLKRLRYVRSCNVAETLNSLV